MNPRLEYKKLIRVGSRFFSGIPHPHLLGDCHSNLLEFRSKASSAENLPVVRGVSCSNFFDDSGSGNPFASFAKGIRCTTLHTLMRRQNGKTGSPKYGQGAVKIHGRSTIDVTGLK
jgi:hypothetical protein